LTNVKGTWTDLKTPSNSYQDKMFNDKIDLYKIRTNNDGKLQIAIFSPTSYVEGSVYRSWTVDDYIEKGFPTWYTLG
jgi:hypothetical protein